MQLDYTVIEIDVDKVAASGVQIDSQSIDLNQPAAIKDKDQVYVVQHPCGKDLAFTSSDVEVSSELPSLCVSEARV